MYGVCGLLSVAITFVLVSRVSPSLSRGPQKTVVYASWNPEHRRTEVHSNGNRKHDVAHAEFTNEINQTGWATLIIRTNPVYPSEIQAYAAGLVEGSSTANLVNLAWNNILRDYCPIPYSAFCVTLRDFLQKNLNWVKEQILAAKDADPYWYQVKLFLIQLKGVEDGVSGNGTGPSIDVDPFGLYLTNVAGDVDTLSQVFGNTSLDEAFLSGKCSALVKLLPGNSDLFVAQDTWTEYNTMLRINKRYILNYKLSAASTDIIPGNDVAFSSYPGRLISGDDFYISNTGLAILETTIGNSNSSLWKYVTTNGTVMEEIRNAVANRLATDGIGWAKTFSRYNSGTVAVLQWMNPMLAMPGPFMAKFRQVLAQFMYFERWHPRIQLSRYNNEWLIVDYKKFLPNQPLKAGTLIVLDQLPGHIEYADLTELLEKQAYFPSYNSPYFPDIFNLSGLPAKVAKYGDWFSYDMNPRARIFRRDQGNITDMTSMVKLMRYNNFQNDPLSRCNCTPPYSGDIAISARSDLNPANGTYPFTSLGHHARGGTDMKVTSSAFVSKMQYIAQCGPTFDQEPPFRWSTSDFRDKYPHAGQPDLFKFDPVLVVW